MHVHAELRNTLPYANDPVVEDVNGRKYYWSDRIIPREKIGDNHFVDYELKAEVMKEGVDKKEKSLSKRIYKAYKEGDQEELDLADDLWHEFLEFYGEKWIEAKKINHASIARNSRLWSRVYAMLVVGKCKFVTLTFTDKCLSSTDFKTRRTYVCRFLKSQAKYYIANIDFGDKNGREHYHAIVMAEHIDFTWWEEHCGTNNWVNTIPFSGTGLKEEYLIDQSKKLGRYVNKLTNHAVKDTAKRWHVIYGKNDFKQVYNAAIALAMNGADNFKDE